MKKEIILGISRNIREIINNKIKIRRLLREGIRKEIREEKREKRIIKEKIIAELQEKRKKKLKKSGTVKRKKEKNKIPKRRGRLRNIKNEFIGEIRNEILEEKGNKNRLTLKMHMKKEMKEKNPEYPSKYYKGKKEKIKSNEIIKYTLGVSRSYHNNKNNIKIYQE